MSSLINKYLQQQLSMEESDESTDEVETGETITEEKEIDESTITPEETGGDVELPESDDQVTGKTTGVEELSDEVEIVEDELDDDVEVTDAVIAEDVLEVVEQQQAVAEVQSDLDAVSDVRDAVESYLELMDLAMEDGGMSAQSAAFLRVGMERYETMFGFDAPLTASVEAFGGSMSQRHATVVSMESVREFLGKLWEAIKNALKRLWAMIQDLFGRISLTARRMEKRSKELSVAAAIAQRDGKTTEVETVTVPKAHRLYASGGKWKGDPAGLKEFYKVADYLVTDHYWQTSKFAEDIIKVMDGITTAEQFDTILDDAGEKVFDHIGKIMGDFPGTAVKWSDQSAIKRDEDAVATPDLPGYKKLFLIVDGERKDGFAVAKSLRFELMDDSQTDKSADDKTTPILSTNDIKVMGADLAKLCQVIADRSKELRTARKVINDLMAAGDRLTQRADKMELSPRARGNVEYLLGGINVFPRLIGASHSGAVAYIVRTISAYLVALEHQLAQYK